MQHQRLLAHGAPLFIELVAAEVLGAHPGRVADVGAGAQIAAHRLAEVVEQDVVVANPIGVVADDAFEGINQSEDTDFESGFLEQFARNSFPEGFADFDGAAGDGPLPRQGVVPALDKEHGAVADNHAANSDDGAFRVFAAPTHRMSPAARDLKDAANTGAGSCICLPRAQDSAGQPANQRCYIIPKSGGTTRGRYTAVAKCPECGALIDIEEDEVEQGEIISCPDCAVELEIVNTHPLELDVLDEEEEDEEEGDEESEDEEDDEEEEESEDEGDGFH